MGDCGITETQSSDHNAQIALRALIGVAREGGGAPPSRHLRVAQLIELICCT